jgi:single-strand DNA-binding protein
VNVNKVIFAGRLTRDPQLKYLPNQTPVVEFGLACNRKFTVNGEQREESTFVDCAAFGKQAEVINQHCQKGKELFIEARIKYDSWDDAKAGTKRSKLTLVVEGFQFIGAKQDQGDDTDQRPKYPRPAGVRTSERPTPANPVSEEQQFKEDDIPF